MTSLQEIKGLNQYCGPAVLAALTGKSTDECAAVISYVTGRNEIKAVKPNDLIKALQKLRFDVIVVNKAASTLFGVLNSISNMNGMYVIGVPKHVVAVEVLDGKIYLIDNHSKTPLAAESSARLMQRVDLIYKVVAKTAPKLLRTEIVLDMHSDYSYINKRFIYEKEEDNTITYIGRLQYSNMEELEQIINELAKIAIVS